MQAELTRLVRSAVGPLAVLAAAAALVLGTWQGLGELLDGFPLLLLASVRDAMLWALAALAGFLIAFALLVAVLARRRGQLPSRRGTFLAAYLAGAPILAVAGYQANWAWGIRPSQLLTADALLRNLGLLALGIAVLSAVAVWLCRLAALDEDPPAGLGVGAPLAAGLCALLALGLHLAFRQPAPGTPPTPIIVILIDALRMDELAVYGYERQTSPAIDAFARDAVRFRQAIAQSTFTKTSVASLFTGRNPFEHGLYWGSHRDESGALTSDVLTEEEVTLAEALRERGYLTTAWVQNSHLTAASGFGQGFVLYNADQGPAPRLLDRFERFAGGPGRRYGFFSYLHLIDLHDPYRPQPPYDTLFGPTAGAYEGIDLDAWGATLEAIRRGERTLPAAQIAELRRLYDGELRAVDDRLRRTFERLRALGLYDKSLIVLTADHGDAFGEHGAISHSTVPYDELVRVPLLVKMPGGVAAGRVVEEQVRLIDLMPTLLEVARARPPRGVSGCSLLPLILGTGSRGDECRVAVSEIAEEGAAPVVAIRRDGFKYIHHEKRAAELYDLASDPAEQHDLLATAPPLLADLHRRALAVIAQRKQLSGRRMDLDERTIRELKALGYLK